MSNRSTRRRFIKASTAAGLGITLMPAVSWGRVLGSNERLNLAVIGTGGMGTSHTRNLVCLLYTSDAADE